MSRICNRPGCDGVAVARLSYDPVGCQVWLDPLAERSGLAQEICELHADRLTVPRGWMVCDRRVDAPALFVTVAEPPRDRRRSAVRVVPPRRSTRVVAAAPELFHPEDPLDYDADADPDAAADEDAAEVVEPELPLRIAADAGRGDDHDRELPRALRATSPLLSRAFRATGPQHSVLTQGGSPRRRPRSADDV